MSSEPIPGGRTLQFKVFSGGTIAVDLAQCEDCPTKACVAVCEVQGGPFVCDEGGLPSLRLTLAEIEKGGCVECLGCELDCSLHGLGALKIDLPLAGFDFYLSSVSQPLVYRR